MSTAYDLDLKEALAQDRSIKAEQFAREVRQCVRAWEGSGLRVTEVARQIGRSHEWVQKRLKAAGIEPKKRKAWEGI